MDYILIFLKSVWFLVSAAWSILMIPTGWGFFGTIVQLIYLCIAWWLYTKFTPQGVQDYISATLRPYIGSGIRKVRDFIGHELIAHSPSAPAAQNAPQVVHVRNWTLKGVLFVWLTGFASAFAWLYAAWPYLRAMLPF